MTSALERVRPRIMASRHIHPAYGQERFGTTEISTPLSSTRAIDPSPPVVEIAAMS
jgi:hypothetical protein